METITFYSYKGGVGRTLALSNTAMYLSKFGIDVCVLDLDLEAPGLHYKFPGHLKPSDAKNGIVDCLYEFTEKRCIPSIKDFSYQIIPPESDQGGLTIIPAGNVASADYWKKLSSINWQDFLYDPENEGIFFFLELKERIKNEINPEFLLIDSRTGVTEMGGISTSLLADKVVFFLTNNRENIEGTCQILKSVRNAERLPKQHPVETVFALTRIPFIKDLESKGENNIVEAVRNGINQIMDSSNKCAEIGEIIVLHSDRNLEISETLAIGNATDSNIPTTVDSTNQNTILGDYLRLFSDIIPDKAVISKLDVIIKKISQSMLSDPDKVQSEFESLVKTYPHKKTYENLISYYFLRNIDKGRVIALYNALWRITKNIDVNVLEKYVNLFLKEDHYPTSERYRYNLEIISDYLINTGKDNYELIRKLADAHIAYGNYKDALKLYFSILDRFEPKGEIIAELLNIYELTGNKPNELYLKYRDIIDADLFLKVKYIQVLDHLDDFEELSRLVFKDSGNTESYLWRHNPRLANKIYNRLGIESTKGLAELNSKLISSIINKDFQEIIEMGRIYSLPDTFLELD